MNASILCDHTEQRSPFINAGDLIDDLNLDVVFDAMANGDEFIAAAARSVLLDHQSVDAQNIVNRQKALSDALQNPDVIKALYSGAKYHTAKYDEYYNVSKPAFSRFTPLAVRVRDAAILFGVLLECMEKITGIIVKNSDKFTSPAFRAFFSSLTGFYDENFLREAKRHIGELQKISEAANIRYGVRLGLGMKGTDYILREINHGGEDKSRRKKRSGIPLANIKTQVHASGLMDAGLMKLLRFLNEINERTLSDIKNIRYELGFYSGCVNLAQKLASIGQPISFPNPQAGKTPSFDKLVDIGLALQNSEPPVGNSLSAEEKRLIIITGANQGGKSTFLRSVGCAELMMRCGMFVTAQSFSSSVYGHVFTHFCRGESRQMDSGRLDEELRRMDEIVRRVKPDSLLLLNESFSSTSEREGSLIAEEIISAFYEQNIQTLFVTHLYDFTKSAFDRNLPGAEFLVAQRNADGSRTYRLFPGQPNRTSFGLDLYRGMIGK